MRPNHDAGDRRAETERDAEGATNATDDAMNMTPPRAVKTSAERVPLAGRALAVITFAIVIASWFSSRFGVRGFLPDYAGDLFGALMLYGTLRQSTRWPVVDRVFIPGVAAVFVFAGCSAAEFAQLRHWLPGTFDPLDFGCYACGVAIGLVLDRWIVPATRR